VGNHLQVLKDGEGRGRKGGPKEKAFHAAELALEAALQAVLDAEECKKAAEQACKFNCGASNII
jgi:hypothetical protein